MKKHFFILICSLIPSLVLAQQTDRSYQIFAGKTGKTIQLEELIKNMKNVDVLVFGEEHNDSIGHQVEGQIYDQLLSTYPSTALSMEMFCTDIQPVLNEYLTGVISEKNFIKESRAWPNYKDYQPLIELARLYHTDVIAANVATRYSNAVSMSGLDKLKEFPEASKAFLPPLPIDTAMGRYYQKFTETLGEHDMGSMKIFQTQNLWDASMAWSIVKYTRLYPKRKIFQINGRFHSDEKIGVIGQLKRYAPKLNLANISCFTAEGPGETDWKKYTGLADYIIITHPGKAN